MRLTPLAAIAFVTVTGANVFGAEPTAPGPTPETRQPAPLHTRPHTVKCATTVNVWVELDSSSLPAHERTNVELKKHVQFSLIGSSPYRGDAVLCSYASRRRDVTTSYSIRCLQPRKEPGSRHSYFCQ